MTTHRRNRRIGAFVALAASLGAAGMGCTLVAGLTTEFSLTGDAGADGSVDATTGDAMTGMDSSRPGDDGGDTDANVTHDAGAFVSCDGTGWHIDCAFGDGGIRPVSLLALDGGTVSSLAVTRRYDFSDALFAIGDQNGTVYLVASKLADTSAQPTEALVQTVPGIGAPRSVQQQLDNTTYIASSRPSDDGGAGTELVATIVSTTGGVSSAAFTPSEADASSVTPVGVLDGTHDTVRLAANIVSTSGTSTPALLYVDLSQGTSVVTLLHAGGSATNANADDQGNEVVGGSLDTDGGYFLDLGSMDAGNQAYVTSGSCMSSAISQAPVVLDEISDVVAISQDVGLGVGRATLDAGQQGLGAVISQSSICGPAGFLSVDGGVFLPGTRVIDDGCAAVAVVGRFDLTGADGTTQHLLSVSSAGFASGVDKTVGNDGVAGVVIPDGAEIAGLVRPHGSDLYVVLTVGSPITQVWLAHFTRPLPDKCGDAGVGDASAESDADTDAGD